MKFYKTKENNLFNLDEITAIYRDPTDDIYRVATVGGQIFSVPELDEEDVDKMMEYNNYFID